MPTNNAINLSSAGVAYYNGTGTFTGIALTSGQVIIGTTGGTPVANTLTAGNAITITNGPGSITIAAIGGGFNWIEVTSPTTITLAPSTGYYIGSGSGVTTFQLPVSPTAGVDIYAITGGGVNSVTWTISQNAGQTIYYLGTKTTTGISGSITSNTGGDSIIILCTAANSYTVIDSVGNLTIV